MGRDGRPFEVGGSFFVIWDRLRKSKAPKPHGGEVGELPYSWHWWVGSVSRRSFWVFLAGGVDTVLIVCDRGRVDLLGRWPGRGLAGRCKVRAGVI